MTSSLSTADSLTSSSAMSPSAAAQDPAPVPPPSVLHLSFNQDADCFTLGTTKGFIAFTVNPFGEFYRHSFSAGVGIVQMLLRSNYFAVVGAGESSRNKVWIWDADRNRGVHELPFRSEVKAVRLRPDRIVVVLMQKVCVYDFSDFREIRQIETQENPLGICEISQSWGSMVLVCLGLQRGSLRVELFNEKTYNYVMAHESDVAFVALMNDGRLMATASTKGTLIRVFNTADGSFLRELRRGSDRASICSISFSSNALWLAVSSAKGTVHVFSLMAESGSQNAEKNNNAPRSRFSFIKGVLPKYFRSEWSVAQFRVQEGIRHIVGFGQLENTVAIFGSDGRFYRCQFDPILGGQMKQLECHNF